MAEPLLAVEGLSSGYGDFQALFDVGLELEEGAVLGLVGANGAGKTTLFKAILGLLPRGRDTVRLRGRPIGDVPTAALPGLGIALVPEGRRLFRSLSVHENLVVAAEHGRTGPWSVERVYELFPILGDKRRDPAPSLSGGQQQMVAIGRALVATNPSVILFDEISLGLEPATARGAVVLAASGWPGPTRRASPHPSADACRSAPADVMPSSRHRPCALE